MDGESIEKETILQNKIICALCAAGHYAANHTVGNFWTGYGGRVKVGNPGEADIWGHRSDGRAFYIEVKLPGFKPRQDQQQFLEAMEKSGALAGCAHSIEEAFKIIGTTI